MNSGSQFTKSVGIFARGIFDHQAAIDSKYEEGLKWMDGLVSSSFAGVLFAQPKLGGKNRSSSRFGLILLFTPLPFKKRASLIQV